jgi:multicomponent K+:H+ antiporter subunit E
MKARPGWFAHPWLSLLVLAGWLLLQQSLHPAHWLSGVLLALLLPRLVHGFLGRSRPARLGVVAARLFGAVLWDIVVSNLVVARIVLTPGSKPQPAWMKLPLRLRHPTAISLLASIITTTPGTVSCVVDAAGHAIWVHALDCADPQALVEQMQQRYEAPLMEMFE